MVSEMVQLNFAMAIDSPGKWDGGWGMGNGDMTTLGHANVSTVKSVSSSRAMIHWKQKGRRNGE